MRCPRFLSNVPKIRRRKFIIVYGVARQAVYYATSSSPSLALAVDFWWESDCENLVELPHDFFLFYLQDVQQPTASLFAKKNSSYFSAVRLFASFSSPKHFPSLTSDIFPLFARTHSHVSLLVLFSSVNCRYKTKKFVYSLMVSHIFYIIHTCLPITCSRLAHTHTFSQTPRHTVCCFK